MNFIDKNFVLNLLKDIGSPIKSENISSDRNLSDQGVDSLDLTNLFFELEEKLNIKIDDEDVAKLKTLDEIINFCNLKMTQA